ncbi:MAG: hypothetical protein IKO66_08115 [Paludibacteraceae bacterium]|nr:hypothetical protein [Paludibacteraceae bacterium]
MAKQEICFIPIGFGAQRYSIFCIYATFSRKKSDFLKKIPQNVWKNEKKAVLLQQI